MRERDIASALAISTLILSAIACNFSNFVENIIGVQPADYRPWPTATPVYTVPSDSACDGGGQPMIEALATSTPENMSLKQYNLCSIDAYFTIDGYKIQVVNGIASRVDGGVLTSTINILTEDTTEIIYSEGETASFSILKARIKFADGTTGISIFLVVPPGGGIVPGQGVEISGDE